MKYTVLVTSEATISRNIVVEAGSVAEAEAAARTQARKEGLLSEKWSIDEAGPFEPYIPDAGNCAEPA